MKKLLLATMIVVCFLGWGIVPVKAASPQSFYLEKVCDGSIAPDICEITYSADPFGVLVNGTIKYDDHAYFENPAGVVHEAATVLITASDGSTARGHISWVMVHGKFSGHFTILPGTGSLAGLHASGRINVVDWDTWLFSWSGTYHIAP